MVSKCLCFLFLTLISLAFASQFPLQYKALKTDSSDEDAPWVWSSSHRNGHRLKFHDDDYDDEEDHDHDDHHEHHERCHHHHGPHFHFGPPSHRHHEYHGSVKNWRHRPDSYPPPLAPFANMFPKETQQIPETKPILNKQGIENSPAPVFEEPEEDDRFAKDSKVPLILFTSTTPRITTSTEKPAYENIDLRFGA